MKVRGFSMIELLVVVGIIIVLAALLFPVFARSKERSKLTRCETRLHSIAQALQMYRADHDDQAFLVLSDRNGGYTTAGKYTYPWNYWKPLQGYMNDGMLFWCLEPPREGITVWNMYGARLWGPPGLRNENSLSIRRFFDPSPTRVVAYCGNHGIEELEKPDTHMSSYASLHKGVFPYLREDGGMALAQSSQIRFSYLWGSDHKWHDTEEEYSTRLWVFPKESWPPDDDFSAELGTGGRG